jgi:hypothetical protein
VVATPDPQPRHILGIFPNHNASPCLSPYVPIGTKEKFKIASEDVFDPGAVALAALAGGAAQLFNSNRPFGQEASGYGRYFGAAYANHVIGDFLTEGAYPSLFHQDPRYFRKGSGSPAGPRVRYAISRVFRTQTDDLTRDFCLARVEHQKQRQKNVARGFVGKTRRPASPSPSRRSALSLPVIDGRRSRSPNPFAS